VVDRTKMLKQLELHEGLRLSPYDDTEGNVTIGIGFNVTARGYRSLEALLGRGIGDPPHVSEAEARAVCQWDIDNLEPQVIKMFPFYLQLNEVRQRVVLDMTFNMGASILEFTRTRAAVEAQDWSLATMQLYRSKWAHQVHGRADRLARMMLTGDDYTS
jgi:lysozyme